MKFVQITISAFSAIQKSFNYRIYFFLVHQINAIDEYSTKVCLMCCDVLVCNTISFVRAVEAQKSLSRIQRIKNKVRNFGKKREEKKDEKQPLPDQSIIDVEMAEDNQYCR